MTFKLEGLVPSITKEEKNVARGSILLFALKLHMPYAFVVKMFHKHFPFSPTFLKHRTTVYKDVDYYVYYAITYVYKDLTISKILRYLKLPSQLT